MTPVEIKAIVEATLFAAGESISAERLASVFPEEERPELSQIREAVIALIAESQGRAYEIIENASGFRVQVKSDYAPWVSRLWEEKAPRYSRATLETLALIAYRQPITRAQIEEIRGVAVNPNILKSLQERNWIRVVGHKEAPGRPELLATTKQFLDDFSLKSLVELPSLAEIKDYDRVEKTVQLSLQLPTPANDSIDETNGNDVVVTEAISQNEITDENVIPFIPVTHEENVAIVEDSATFVAVSEALYSDTTAVTEIEYSANEFNEELKIAEAMIEFTDHTDAEKNNEEEISEKSITTETES